MQRKPGKAGEFSSAGPSDPACLLCEPMDLARYTCRGFSGDFDRIMRDVPVAGIDKQQAESMIRLCDATEAVLYGPQFSTQAIRYYPGARLALERIVGSALADPLLF